MVVWCLCGWSRLLGSAWVAWPDVGVRVGALMAWAVWAVGTRLLVAGRPVWAWLVCVGGMGRGVGYVCVEGVVGRVGALWAMRLVVEMLVMPTGGGCCRRRNGFDWLMWVLQAMRWADGDGVVGDGAGAGGEGGGSGGRRRRCNGRWRRW